MNIETWLLAVGELLGFIAALLAIFYVCVFLTGIIAGLRARNARHRATPGRRTSFVPESEGGDHGSGV